MTPIEKSRNGNQDDIDIMGYSVQIIILHTVMAAVFVLNRSIDKTKGIAAH